MAATATVARRLVSPLTSASLGVLAEQSIDDSVATEQLDRDSQHLSENEELIEGVDGNSFVNDFLNNLFQGTTTGSTANALLMKQRRGLGDIENTKYQSLVEQGK